MNNIHTCFTSRSDSFVLGSRAPAPRLTSLNHSARALLPCGCRATLLSSRHAKHVRGLQRKDRRSCKVQAEAGAEEVSLAPVKPKTAVGKMLNYYLKMEPHLFRAAIDEQFARIRRELDEKEKEKEELEQADTKKQATKGEIVLYRRMDELRRSEQRATVEELMYVSVLEKFLSLGVNMMPRLETVVETPGNIKALTEGIHSREALDMVKEHVRMLMGEAAKAYSSAIIKMPKVQAVQMYAASIMFGYFLRRVDRRFQLERSAGTFVDPNAREEAVARLERLFMQAESLDLSDSPDSPSAASSSSSSSDASASSSGRSSMSEGFQSDTIAGSLGAGQPQSKDSGGKGSLRSYVETFTPETLQEVSRILSAEAATLVEMQTTALFGDFKVLQKQMEEAVGSNARSMEELMGNVRKAMDEGRVDVVSITAGTQRRAVLEAIAFGTFLRDVEATVDTEYALLTPVTSAPRRDDGGGGGGGGGLVKSR